MRKTVKNIGRPKIILSIVLTLALLFCLAPPISVSGVANLFLACGDDTLYPLSSAPYYTAGTYYAPYFAFSAFGVRYNYYSEKSTAMVFMGQRLLVFDLAAGTCTDDKDNPRYPAAIFRGGVVYLPLSVMCEQFGLKWTFITGNEYGDVLRIKNGSEILSDYSFVTAARSLMRSYAADAEQSASTAAPTATPPVIPPTPAGHEDITIYLSFIGLPDAGTLYQLENAGYTACFFFSAADVLKDPDTIRRVFVNGSSIGVLPDEDGDFDTSRRMIFEAAHIFPVLAASTDDDVYAQSAKSLGLAYKPAGITLTDDLAAVTKAIGVSGTQIRIICGADTPHLLYLFLDLLKTGRYTVKPLREV